MKTIAIFLVAVVVSIHALEDVELSQKWAKFQVDFGRSYKSPVEVQKRMSIFKAALEDIEAHNSQFDNGLVSYKKGINQFADWTKDEFRQFVNSGLGKMRAPVGEIYVPTEVASLPASVDWREKGVVTAIKDQGSCEGCWAFSATGALEGQYALSSGSLVSFSEQNLIDCSSREGNQGCEGGWMYQAFDYVKKSGIESETDYPFLGVDGRCRADSSKIVTKISSYKQIKKNNEEDLQNALANKGPVSVAIDATTSLQLYSSGVFVDRTCNKNSLNHGVLAVGYGTENGQDYYLIKNSWGPTWGESGYVRFARNHNNMCGIASVAHYPQI